MTNDETIVSSIPTSPAIVCPLSQCCLRNRYNGGVNGSVNDADGDQDHYLYHWETVRVFKSLEDFFAGSAMKDSASVKQLLGVDDFPEKAKKVIENVVRATVEVRGALLRQGLNGHSFDPLFKSVAPDTKKGDCNGVLEVPFSSSPPPPPPLPPH